jgi:hypothetical integral membrane protein (TIGR02206 family)
MDSGPSFHAFGVAHITVIALTISLPFVLAAFVRRSKVRLVERFIGIALSGLLVGNYFTYLVFVRRFELASWQESLPLQLCDWAMVVVIVALLTGKERWFEVAYFWGIGGTLQAVLTPNLPYGFPDLRFISFFVSHSGIIIGIIFMMLVHKHRPSPWSMLHTFVWTEFYFVITFTIDQITGVNYGFLLHKPEAFSLLSFLSDSRPLYLLQFHLLAWVFFCLLYAPFLMADLVRRKNSR